MIYQEQTIQAYLLGELSESEKDNLEREYFADKGLFEEIVRVENELVDQYAHGRLPAATRERFEKFYLAHPQRRERAIFARALAERLEQTGTLEGNPGGREGWLNRLVGWLGGPRPAWAFATIALLIAVAAGWSLLENSHLRQELARVQSERIERELEERELRDRVANEQLRNKQLSEEIDRLHSEPANITPPGGGAKIVTLLLTIGGTRDVDSGQPKVLVIPTGAEQVRVQLKLLEKDYSSYQAILQSATGSTIFSSKRLPATGVNLSVLIPARLFSSNDYMLTTRGFGKGSEAEDVSKSLIRVQRR